jgi:hypothetical protein
MRDDNLYDSDIAAWAVQQADALRRRAANEIDWDNVAEEIEDVGISETNATLAQIDNILRHRLYLLGWPETLNQRAWQAELREFQRQLRRHYRPSMTGREKVTDAVVREAYGAALEYCLAHMDVAPTRPLPVECPWSLEELLGER